MIDRRSNLYSPRLRKRKRKVLYVKIGFFTILFVLLFVGALVVIRLPQVRITEVVVSGGESVVPPEPVEAIAREVMQGNYGWILPKDNSFLYPKAVIEQEVLNSFPRVKSLSMRRVGLQTLSLELILRKQVALWCGVTFTADRSAPCYSFDDTGVIFEPSLSPGTTTIRYFGATVGTSTTLFGTQAVREADLKKLALFFIALSGESYQVTDVVLLDGGMTELYLRGGGKLIVDRTQDFSVTLRNLNLLVADSGFTGRGKDGLLKVEYIDLRTNGKIFYKVKGGTEKEATN